MAVREEHGHGNGGEELDLDSVSILQSLVRGPVNEFQVLGGGGVHADTFLSRTDLCDGAQKPDSLAGRCRIPIIVYIHMIQAWSWNAINIYPSNCPCIIN